MNKLNQDTRATLVRSARQFFSGTMLSRISGMLRDMAMAYVFGTQNSIAAFLVAFRWAHLLRRLFGEGALQAAFIPQFESLRGEDPKQACHFFRDLKATLFISLISLILAISLGLGALLYFVDFSSDNREILSLTLLLMPSLLFICLFGLNASLLQCERSYFLPGVAPVAFNLVWIIGVFVVASYSPLTRMSWLSFWVIVACFCQWLVTMPGIISILRQQKIKFWHMDGLWSAEVKSILKPLSLGIVGVAATQVNNAMDGVFARLADLEGPAYLWYALRIQQLPLALFGVAISGALLPPLSRAFKANDRQSYLNFIEFAIQRTFDLMIPITFATFLIGDIGINLIYGHGDFNDASIVGTALCLWGYNAGLIPMTLVIVLATAFYAQNNQRIPALASVVAMITNVLLNAWMVMGFGWGAVSVAIATSVSAGVNLFILGMAFPEIKQILSRRLFVKIGNSLFISCCAAAALLVVEHLWLEGSSALQMIASGHVSYPKQFSVQLFQLMLRAGIFTLVLLLRKVLPRPVQVTS